MYTQLSLNAALNKIGYTEYNDNLSEEYEVPLHIKKKQGCEKAIVFNGEKTPYPIASNLTDTRNKLLRITGMKNSRELYEHLTLQPLDPDKAFEKKDYNNYYMEKKLKANELGALKYYEKDAGYYITSGIIVTRVEASFNASIHRLLVVDEKHLAARIVPRQLYSVIKESRSMGKELPITILLGSHPLVMLAASTTPSLGKYELGLLPYFTGDKISGVESPLHGHLIPSYTSVIIEAKVTLDDIEEGPFVDAMGTYDKKRLQPLIEIEGVWVNTRVKPFYHAILPGGYEHSYLMGVPREAQIWSTASKTVPRVGEIRLTRASGGWLHAVLSIEKNHDEDGKNAILAAFAGHPSLKHIVVVDTDVNVDDPEDVEWAVATRFQADKDLIIIKRARGSTLDPSAEEGVTSKMGLDATKPIHSAYTYEKARIPGE